MSGQFFLVPKFYLGMPVLMLCIIQVVLCIAKGQAFPTFEVGNEKWNGEVLNGGCSSTQPTIYNFTT